MEVYIRTIALYLIAGLAEIGGGLWMTGDPIILICWVLP